MKKFNILCLVVILLAAQEVCFAWPRKFSLPAGNTLMLGTAKINITPKTPIPMAGYGGRDNPFKGVHDDLFARAMVLSDGKNKMALISVELIGVSPSIWKDVTEALEKKAGIKRDFVLLSAVHNHAGPVVNTFKINDSPEVLAYLEELKGKIIAATLEASRNMVPVTMGVGKGECKMNINRRAQNGKGEITLGLNPYGPCDHEVGVVRFEDKTGKLVFVMMNWPCHGVALGPSNYMISGDWPGAASDYVEKSLGGNGVAMVTIGASGDINPLYGPHIDFESRNDYAFAKDAIGEDLGKESLRVMKEMKGLSSGMISSSQRVISLPSKEEYGKDSLQVRLSVIKIGTIILAGVSGEVFNQISVNIRHKSPYANTFMITHCNGSSGYLITDAAYGEGGYEVRTTRAKSGAEKAITENLLAMINEL